MLSSYLYCVCMERPSKTDRSIPLPTVRASGGLLGDQPDPAAPADPADQRPHHDIIHHLSANPSRVEMTGLADPTLAL